MSSTHSKISEGLILFIDDDKDEHELFAHALKAIKIKNKVNVFTNGEDALEFIRNTKETIYLIFCDISMPKMDGIEFKRRIESDGDLKAKAIPFIFHSSSTSPVEVRTAYSLNIQGFIKKGDYQETAELFKSAFFFWSNCLHPKDFAS
jgi:CheY-like chemotaxis protein